MVQVDGGIAYSDIDVGDVADDIVLRVQDGQGGHTFVVHELQRRG